MKEDIKKIYESKLGRNIVIGIGVVIVILGILEVGMSVGEHRARFAGEFGNNFERNFLGPRDGMMRGMFFEERMPGGHGAAGEIVSINLPQIVVSGPDNLEKIIVVGTSTAVHEFQQNLQSTDLKVGDFIVVLGSPNSQGQIEAKLVRIMPSPMMQTPTSKESQ